MKLFLGFLTLVVFSINSISQSQGGEIQKIATYCKVWGFLKYHHPAVATGKRDWDIEFTSGLKAVEMLNSKEEINCFYSNWINSLGAIKSSKKGISTDKNNLESNLDFEWINDSSSFTQEVMDQLQKIRNCKRRNSNYYVQYGKYIHNTTFQNEKTYPDSIFPSPELRLLGLSRYWNIIEYFYPYKYVIGENWNVVLSNMIPKFKDASDTISYHLAMLELTASINDSHAYFSSDYTKSYFGLKWVPFRFKIIDNKAVCKGFYNDSLCQLNDIRIGDVFLELNGVPISTIIENQKNYICASNESVKLRNMAFAIFNGNSDSVHVTFERNGNVLQKTIGRYLYKDLNFKWSSVNPKSAWSILEKNIGYIDLSLVTPEEAADVLEFVKNTDVLVLDVRNYPSGAMYEISKFLNSSSMPFVKFTLPDISNPGIFHFTRNYFCGKRNSHHYKGKVILLFNEISQSHSEFTLMALKTAPNVIGVGSQTAGADGNVSEIVFPGDYRTFMTGIGVYFPDGRETQRIGIVPDIEVRQTIEGIRAGRDEVLEKALELARAGLK